MSGETSHSFRRQRLPVLIPFGQEKNQGRSNGYADGTEDPMAILKDVAAGIAGAFYTMPEREQAIRHAIGAAQPGDVVVVP